MPYCATPPSGPRLQGRPVRENPPLVSEPRVTFRFGWTPTEIVGDGSMRRIRFASTYGDGEGELEAGLVIGAIAGHSTRGN